MEKMKVCQDLRWIMLKKIIPQIHIQLLQNPKTKFDFILQEKKHKKNKSNFWIS